MPRRDTKIESEGAEFLVLGQLLIRGVQCHKAYTQTAGYDLFALSNDHKRTLTIQVKSRWDQKARGFFLKAVDADFVVAVFLNRSTKGLRDSADPKYYVLPKRIVKKYQREEKVPKVYLPDIYNRERYLSAWHLIEKSLR